MNRGPTAGQFVNEACLSAAGLTADMIAYGIQYAHGILDAIDCTLVLRGEPRLSNMIELANLSSVVGNVLGSGIAKASNGAFTRNGPHKYPDLLPKSANAREVEIKVALEMNKPKGHLAKPGYHLTCRYVLISKDGEFRGGKENRGDVVSIWEVRFGLLDKTDYNVSNTEGDSGKTAVVNAAGLKKLTIVYCDIGRCPFAPNGTVYRVYQELYPDLS